MMVPVAGEGDFVALLDQLGSAEFDACVNLASGLSTALTALISHPIVAGICRRCEAEPVHVADVLDRIESLSHREVDPTYTSPVDAALFALLFVLDRCEPLAAPAGANAALRAPAIFWAGRFARRLLDDLELSAPAREEPARTASLSAAEGALRSLGVPEPPRGLHGPRRTMTRAVEEVSFA